MPPLTTFDKTIVALALANSIGVPASQAATINVDATCTLQDAIRSANTNMAVASSDCEVGDVGLDVIDIPTQTITLMDVDPDGDQFGSSGLPLISSEITIQGNGSTIQAINLPDQTPSSACGPNDCFRIVALEYGNSSASLTLESITLTGGIAIYNGDGGYGGAIYVGSDNSLTLNDATITGNSSDGYGGGIYAFSTVNIEIGNSTISNNTAQSGGGALSIRYGYTLNIMNSTVSRNSVLSGGGEKGGGVDSYNTYMTIVNSTISGNVAPSRGSGLYLNATSLSMVNSTISNNATSASLQFVGNDSVLTYATIINSVVANNAQGDCVVSGSPAYTQLTTNDNNWFEDASCDGVADGDPILGSLRDNGGPTKTHAPQEYSGLIGAGLISSCISAPVNSLDQRGESRGLMGSCFIGAVEGVVEDPSLDASFFVIPLPSGKTVIVEL